MCPDLKKVVLSEGLETIPEDCFWQSGLEEIRIPESVRTIEKSAFNECKSLKTISLPHSLQTIGESCFRESGLTELIIPNSVKKIERGTLS